MLSVSSGMLLTLCAHEIFIETCMLLINITHYSGLYSCYSFAIQFDMSKISGALSPITAKCIETQLVPNESSGKDLQIRHRSYYVIYYQVAASWHNLHHKVSMSIKLFLLLFFFLLMSLFGQQLLYRKGKTGNNILRTLYMCTYR